jgi:cytoskeletal protein RodZ
MNIPQRAIRTLGLLLIAGLCMTPEMMQAAVQQSAQSSSTQENKQGTQNSQPADQSQGQTKPKTSGTTVDPSQAPLQPVTTYPEAPTPQPEQQPATPQTVQQSEQPQQQPQKPAAEPAGAATAEKVPTTGGAASRPAGVAIAPAKQHQTRSLLIKIGAIAAAGVAAGTVYGLSRSTPSSPSSGVRK